MKMDFEENPLNLDDLKDALLAHICNQTQVSIKSQQIDEPELNFDEKLEIVKNLLNDSHLKFLHRFGAHLRKDHLIYFDDSNESEINELLRTLRHDLDHLTVRVKNRRYAAMVKMLQEDDEFFSLAEMKSRDPLLYEQYVGQYETPEEKRANTRPNAETDTLVDILLKGIDKKHNDEVEEEQRKFQQNPKDDENDEDETQDSSSSVPKESQWGNFDDEKPSAAQPQPSSSRKRHAKSIAAKEKNLLRKEFCSIMYQNFLTGKDSEHFDYTTVDDNEDYDNVSEHDQDEEDKYFDDEDDPEEITDEPILDQHPNIAAEDDEDDLDIYMKHLKNNMIKQSNNVYEDEEFDDDEN